MRQRCTDKTDPIHRERNERDRNPSSLNSVRARGPSSSGNTGSATGISQQVVQRRAGNARYRRSTRCRHGAHGV